MRVPQGSLDCVGRHGLVLGGGGGSTGSGVAVRHDKVQHGGDHLEQDGDDQHDEGRAVVPVILVDEAIEVAPDVSEAASGEADHRDHAGSNGNQRGDTTNELVSECVSSAAGALEISEKTNDTQSQSNACKAHASSHGHATVVAITFSAIFTVSIRKQHVRRRRVIMSGNAFHEKLPNTDVNFEAVA